MGDDDALPLTAEVPWPPEPVVTDTAVAIPVNGEPEPPSEPHDYNLPPLNVFDACPKCGDQSYTKNYHAMLHLSEPCGRAYAREAQANGWNFPEHVCCKCTRCSHGWTTQVAIL